MYQTTFKIIFWLRSSLLILEKARVHFLAVVADPREPSDHRVKAADLVFPDGVSSTGVSHVARAPGDLREGYLGLKGSLWPSEAGDEEDQM